MSIVFSKPHTSEPYSKIGSTTESIILVEDQYELAGLYIENKERLIFPSLFQNCHCN